MESGVAPTQSATDINVDMQYTTPSQISAAMEPHATIAHFDGDKLTVYPSVQIVASAVQALATTLEMDEDNIHVKSPFIGGGFGSKLGLHYDAILACIGARYLERPVKVALSRRHVFYNTVKDTSLALPITVQCQKRKDIPSQKPLGRAQELPTMRTTLIALTG